MFDHEELIVTAELLIFAGDILWDELNGKPISGPARDALIDWDAQRAKLREQCELLRRAEA